MPAAPIAISSSAAPSSSFQLPLPVLVAIFCLLWSSAFAVAKLAIADCPPLLVLTTRFLIAGAIVLGAAAIWRMPFDLSRRDVAVFALLGIANQAVYLGLGYVALRSISSGLGAVIISSNPVLTAVLAAVFLNERMTWRKVAGLLLGIGGVVFVVESRLTGGLEHPIGIALSIAALISLAGGTILFKLFAPKGGLWIGNGVQSLAAGLATLPFALTFESVGDVVPTWRLLGSMAYLALFVSVFAYLVWFQLLKLSGATAASSYHFLMPPLGMLFGWQLLGEHVALSDFVGIVPVAIGIYLVTRAGSPDSKAVAKPRNH